MTNIFIPAQDLKARYRVLGHFYDLHLQEGEPQKCRSVLEISEKTSFEDKIADAIFVMMNPGSSRPTEEKNTPGSINHISEQLVTTVADTTQYQVMRLMSHMKWRYARIINLSDLRDPNSGSFTQRYTRLEKEFDTKEHSIFSPERSKQLTNHLIRKPEAPIICAWGVSDELNPLIERARAVLQFEKGVTGLAKSSEAWKYYHPLPSLHNKKEEWLAQMLKKLGSPIANLTDTPAN